MHDDGPIRSPQNALLKRAAAVRRGKEADTLFLEGARLVEDALGAGVAPELILIDAARADDSRFGPLAARPEARLVQGDLLERLSALDTAPGVVALAPRPAQRSLESLELGKAGLALGVAGVSDPGNLGALARSAEAAGASALIVVRGGARPFGEKALRGSMGSLLRLPVFEVASVDAARDAIDARHVTARVDGTPYAEHDWSGPTVLWMPGEVGDAVGALAACDGVSIPMAGGVESLNVTVAASVLLFAAGRNGGGGGVEAHP